MGKSKKKAKSVASKGGNGNQGGQLPQSNEPKVEASDLSVLPLDYFEMKPIEMHAAFKRGETDVFTEEIAWLEEEHAKYVEYGLSHRLSTKQKADKKAFVLYIGKLHSIEKFAKDAQNRDQEEAEEAQ